MDIKCVREEDCETISTRQKEYLINIMKTKYMLVDEKRYRPDFDYEIRTTLYPLFIDKNTINEIGGMLNKDDRWVLQQFRHSNNVLDESCRKIKPYNEEEVNMLFSEANKYCNVRLNRV